MAASGHLEWWQTIVGRLIRIQFSPGSFRRKFTALDPDTQAFLDAHGGHGFAGAEGYVSDWPSAA